MEHRTALGVFLALAVNRPVVALNGRASLTSGGKRTCTATAGRRALSSLPANSASSLDLVVSDLVDVDANLLHPHLASDIEHHIQVIYLKVCMCMRLYNSVNGQLSKPWHFDSWCLLCIIHCCMRMILDSRVVSFTR